MNEAHYTLFARSRPIRVAFLISTDHFKPELDRFHALVDAVIDWNNEHWGGRSNHIAFFTGETLSESEWRQVEMADPDHVLAFAPLSQQFILELHDRVDPCYLHMDDVRESDLDKIHVSLDGIGIPPTFENLHRLSGRKPFANAGDEALLMFEFGESCDAAVKRFIRRNFGTYYQRVDPNSGKIRRIAWLENLLPQITTRSLRISDVTTLAAALTEISGRARAKDIRPGIPHIAPYQLASLFLSRWPSHELRETYQLIIGDSADDLSEHWNGVRRKFNWSQTHRHQLWIPSGLLADSAFRESLHDWLCHFGNARSGHRVELLSHSLSENDLADFQNYFRQHKFPVGITFISSATITQRRQRAESEREENRRFIPWTSSEDVARYTGSGSSEVFTLAKPDPLDNENPDGSWMVDVQIEHLSRVRGGFLNQSWWHLPRRNSGGALRALFRQPARINRYGRFSVEVRNRESGIAGRIKPELRLQLLSESDLIRLFVTEPYRTSLVVSDARNNARPAERIVRGCQTSTKGAYLAGLIELFGNFWTAKDFCERRLWRDLFSRLAGHQSGKGEKLGQQVVELLTKRGAGKGREDAFELADEILHLVRGQLKAQHVSFRDCLRERNQAEKKGLPEVLVYPQGQTIVEHHGTRPITVKELEEGLDTLLALGVLRLGIERKCPRCKVSSWFHIDSLTHYITCPGCGYRDALGSREPWSYTLNTLAQMCVLQGAVAVLHALTILSSEARTFFAYSPSLDLFRRNSAEAWHEVDVVCILDGALVIGEVKDGPISKEAFDNLAEIAEAVRPQRTIVFLPLQSVVDQEKELRVWLGELQSRVRPLGTTAEIFAVPAY